METSTQINIVVGKEEHINIFIGKDRVTWSAETPDGYIRLPDVSITNGDVRNALIQARAEIERVVAKAPHKRGRPKKWLQQYRWVDRQLRRLWTPQTHTTPQAEPHVGSQTVKAEVNQPTESVMPLVISGLLH